MAEDAKERQVEVKTGAWASDGTFLGEIVRFRGEEIGGHTDLTGEHSSRGDRATTYTLYRCPGGYRVHIKEYSRQQDQGSRAWLEPTISPDSLVAQEEPPRTYATYTEDPDSLGDEEGESPVYDAFSEKEARRRYPQLFAASGTLNEPDLD